MKTTDLSTIMRMAWRFFHITGHVFAECLKQAWANFKLVAAMKKGVVRFYYQKVDGTRREAWGTLCESLIPATGNDDRKRNDTVQVYFDTERGEWRCYKRLNLVL